MKVDLVSLGGGIDWPLGRSWTAAPTPQALESTCADLSSASSADAVFFWDPRLGVPEPGVVEKALCRPGDVWHAGLCLGTGGKPSLIDTVQPTWMLNRDPAASIEATSWRVSLAACLVRTDVLRKLGGVRGSFVSIDGAALELGHRWTSGGAFVRHVPSLVPHEVALVAEPPVEDALRFIAARYGARWATWALARALWTGIVSRRDAMRAAHVVLERQVPDAPPLRVAWSSADFTKATVGVLIPTLDRYSYLRTVLDQLRQQNPRPSEIVVIDQTPPERRDLSLVSDFPDLPLTMLYRDRPGQCSARNAGLERLTTDFILFLDDDDEVPPDLIEVHLASLAEFGSDVSSGIANEVGAELPADFRHIRPSDVFPTNNTLIRRELLLRSGLFDLAFETGARADGDLGMRVYLTGALMVLNPHAAVLHHRAPTGGLRAHGARVITRASSRRRVTHRHLPSVTELYLAHRYFTPRQVRERLWIATLGTASMRGSRRRKALKALFATLTVPHTVTVLAARRREARRMLDTYPQIPLLTHASRRSL